MHETGTGSPDHDHAEASDGKPRIGFVGAGHVGAVLAPAFHNAGWPVTAVASRDEAKRNELTALVPGSRGFAEPNAVLDEADVIFLTVPDDALPALAAELHLYSGQALVHTSGALPAAVLAPAQAAGTSVGSFHPLVAFADRELALASLVGATIALEGDPSILPLLADLAESIGARPVRLPEGTKTAYHAAASLAAGGVVALLDALAEIGAQSGFDEATALSIYLPLTRQALANAEALGTAQALTGPVLRGDAGTLRAHLEFIRSETPQALPLYLELCRRELAIAVRRGALDESRQAELEVLLRAGVGPV